MTKKEYAISLHDKKFNCCQSVACAFADELGIDEKILFQAGEAFGLGMGCELGTCGAITGAVLLAGFKNSDGNLVAPGTKAETYVLSKEILNQFLSKNGSLVCQELRGTLTNTPLRSCAGCIEDGVEIAANVLKL